MAVRGNPNVDRAQRRWLKHRNEGENDEQMECEISCDEALGKGSSVVAVR
jgi:hypothetical protein